MNKWTRPNPVFISRIMTPVTIIPKLDRLHFFLIRVYFSVLYLVYLNMHACMKIKEESTRNEFIRASFEKKKILFVGK